MSKEKTSLSVLLEHLGIGRPYAWQLEAFDRLCDGDPPAQIKVPTAAGKTAIIPIFVAALAAQAAEGRALIPRRLVHVVNRRVLVDEAAGLAERIVLGLEQAVELRPLRDALGSLSASGQPLAVSTLRGGIDDNGAWSLDPLTPAIFLSAPDMLGSRLLFRGYGVGRSRSATHAGLLGCDTLVVHDEAHLAPAFTSLLRQIEALAEAGAQRIGRPALRVIELTATLSGSGAGRPLVCDVSEDPALAKRMAASKRLDIIDVRTLNPAKPLTAMEDAIVDFAAEKRDANLAVAIFVSSPASSDRIARRLQKRGIDQSRIVALTGTMRGRERADLMNATAFRRFDPGARRVSDGTAYFIATSAGEIGLDIDADVGLFDLTTLDRFIQRAGRVNRRGMGVGALRLIHAGGDEAPPALRHHAVTALRLLGALPAIDGAADASPLALSRLCDHPEYPDAIEPPPRTRRLEPSIVDMLSMTSLRLDEIRSPSPAVFIHGLVDEEADVALAWRDLPRPTAEFGDWLDVWPLAAAELAKMPIEPARRFLRERLMACQDGSIAVLAAALDAQGLPISDDALLKPGMPVNRWVGRLRPGTTVLLASEVGGLTPQGVPSPESADPVPDVSAGFADANGMRRLEVRRIDLTYSPTEEGAQWRSGRLSASSLPQLLQTLADGLEIVFDDAPRAFPDKEWSGAVHLWLSRPEIRSADSGDLASMVGRDRLLDEHLDLTARAARRLCGHLGLPAEFASAQVRAAAEHDRGKAWERWQRAIGNPNLGRPLGKSARAEFDLKINDGYRHELGSVVDRGEALTLLERHLVAAHHGWSRPGFREAALAKAGCAVAGIAASNGFAALHRALGPWALCYLEAVLKSADVLAEVLDETLAADDAQALPERAETPTIAPINEGIFRIAVDISNFGEYLAALGLAALVDRRGAAIRLGWEPGHFVIEGVENLTVLETLESLRGAQVRADEQLTTIAQRDAAYPPLLLLLEDGSKLALNHWLDERLQAASGWKLGAGQTTAAKTLASVAGACSASLDLPGFDPTGIFHIGGNRVGADASKFRFDAATNWSARDAGFSLNESDKFKSTRPWVELLSAIGLQHFFVPPGDAASAYFTWGGRLSPTLALAAVKGVLPNCDRGYRPTVVPNGKMKDIFTSQPIVTERKRAWPANIRVI